MNEMPGVLKVKVNIIDLMKERPDLFLARFGRALELLEQVGKSKNLDEYDNWTIPDSLVEDIREFLRNK